jgi:hypothetical protein
LVVNTINSKFWVGTWRRKAKLAKTGRSLEGAGEEAEQGTGEQEVVLEGSRA